MNTKQKTESKKSKKDKPELANVEEDDNNAIEAEKANDEKVKLGDDNKNRHQIILDNLLDVRGRLMLIDPNVLSREEKINWNNQMFEVNNNIIIMEGAILDSISKKYADAIPGLENATNSLERDLHSLKRANDIISTIGSALGVITGIIGLI